MGKQFSLSLLILSVFFSQESWASIAENKNLSDLHIRHKRLIDKSPRGNRRVIIQEVPYIVNIKRNAVSICGGSILSPILILTAAHCFLLNPAFRIQGPIVYTVLSGSGKKNRGIRHDIMRKITHPNFIPPLYVNDIALIVIYPRIDFVLSPNRKISLYNGKFARNAFGIFSGWGCTEMEPETVYPDELRSVKVSLISLFECQDSYKGIRLITQDNICVYDRQKTSCNGDGGNPLVINGLLAGIMSGSYGPKPGVYPDVFINLAAANNHVWINSILIRLGI